MNTALNSETRQFRVPPLLTGAHRRSPSSAQLPPEPRFRTFPSDFSAPVRHLSPRNAARATVSKGNGDRKGRRVTRNSRMEALSSSLIVPSCQPSPPLPPTPAFPLFYFFDPSNPAKTPENQRESDRMLLNQTESGRIPLN